MATEKDPAGGLVLFPPSSPAGSFSVAMVGLLPLLRNRSRCRNTGRGQTMRGIVGGGANSPREWVFKGRDSPLAWVIR